MHAGDHVGEFGSVDAKAGDSGTGNYFAIQMLEDTVFATLTGRGHSFVSGTVANYTYPKNLIKYGHWTAYDITSGSCTLYKSNPNTA